MVKHETKNEKQKLISIIFNEYNSYINTLFMINRKTPTISPFNNEAFLVVIMDLLPIKRGLYFGRDFALEIF